MGAPNITKITTVIGNTGTMYPVPTTASVIVSNPAGSNKVFKVNALYVSNVDTATAYKVTTDFYRNGTAYNITSTTPIPAMSTLDIISKSIYLTEGDSLRLTSDLTNKLHAVCSWEEMS